MHLKTSAVAVALALGSTASALAAGLPVLQGPSSSQSSYLVGTSPGVEFAPILTVGDAAPNGYKMVGIPDGLGAIDNGDTITVFMNHELSGSQGVGRAHNPTGKGAFVSTWTVNKSNLSVQHGADLVQTVASWNSGSNNFQLNAAETFLRLCSADLPALTAFYNPTSGLGFNGRIFMNGEETGAEGRAYGHIVTGINKGVSYELPSLGKFSWENSVANPYAQDKTIVVGLDDSTPGQVYVYVGNKQNTGSAVEMAGLHGGNLYGVKVSGVAVESNAGIANGTAFSMYNLGDVRNTSGATLQADSTAAGVTEFGRPEDGQWDPTNPNVFYFATTGTASVPSKLYKLSFNDVANPEAGGKVETLLDGTEGGVTLDNLTVSADGKKIILQEDPGGSSRLAKVWEYDIASDALVELGEHDPNRFLAGAPNFLTTNEESSGVIDITSMLAGQAGYDTANYRYYLLDVQAHYGLDTALVEGGQLGIMAVPVPEPSTYAMMGVGLGMVAFALRRRQRKEQRTRLLAV